MKGRNALLVAGFLASTFLAWRASASVTSIVSFGDSLSDNGNASIATSGAEPGANYATRSIPGVPFPVGEYTDGPATTPGTSSPVGLWNEQLAARLGLANPVPVLAPGGGTIYAAGGATTGTNGSSDMQDQVNLFVSQHPGSAPATALYTFWGGANDILTGQSPTAAADNIAAQIRQVATGGGKTFLWLNLPALGATPNGASQAATLNAATLAFNTEYSVDLASLKSQGLNVVGVDMASLFADMQSNPGNYGFTNTTSPARGVSGANPNQYVFWDGLHPTTETDMYISNAALAQLPEPASLGVILVIGCGALGRRCHRRSKGH